MPANLTPQYKAAEDAFREAETVEEKISCLEEMLRIIPKHKGTDHLQGDLRRKLSKLRQQAESDSSKSKKSYSHKIKREGAGQVAMVGMPNCGKSALMGALSGAEPEVAAYPFTTREPAPGMMPYQDIQIQLIDLPPLSDEHEEHWLMDLVKAADAVVIVLDLEDDPLVQLNFVLERFEQKRFMPSQMAESVPDDERPLNIVYRPCILLGNKMDSRGSDDSWELFNEMSEDPFEKYAVSAVSCEGLEKLPEILFKLLGIIRVYPKSPGHKADMEEPFVLPDGSCVLDFAEAVHREVAESLKYALIWSKNKFDGQMVKIDEKLLDGDIVELHS